MEQQVRLLLAWMDDQDAALALLGRKPSPGENGHHSRIWQASKNALMQRAPFRPSPAGLSQFRGKLKERALAFQQRPDVVAALQGLDWTIGSIDLRHLLSLRWSIVEDDAAKRAEAVAPNDVDGLFSFCLPQPGPGLTLTARIDPDRKALTFRSLDPNFGIGQPLMADIEVAQAPGQPGRKEKFIGFPLHFGSPFIQVVEFKGRLFLKNGYHRCYGLLQRSIYKIPCVFIRAGDFAEIGTAETGSIPYDILFGDRPPLISDFLADSVSRTVVRTSQTKLVRVAAAEFVVELV